MKLLIQLTMLTFSLFLLSPLSLSSQKYEFRAAWIATVNNIDWPSSKNLSVAEQKAEFTNLLDMLKRTGMNAVVVQVRPSADAFYPSPYEPWSEWLMGKQAQPPFPYYDPLAFMIEETHKRGMEFHAWLNPYRAVFNTKTSSISSKHITRTHPEWFLKYGDKKYFNPGLPAVMEFVASIVKDIISRYDVDAIHLDDYFYPYRIAGKEFPDNITYKKYGKGMDKDEWRRSNCDSIVKMIHETILQTNPMVKFGISPFGVWRNKSRDIMGSDTRAGQTNYDDLYADILLWLQKGWIDYVAPQLYWEIGNPLCDYETLLNWWAENSYGRHVYIGHAVYRAAVRPTSAWRNRNELPDEIKMLRENKHVQGSIYFSSKSFTYNPNGWRDSLRNNYYKHPALIPPMFWIDSVPPQKPVITSFKEITKGPGGYFLMEGNSLNAGETETVKNYVLYVSDNLDSLMKIPTMIVAADSTKQFKIIIPAANMETTWNDCYIAVSCVDKENNESAPGNIIELKKKNNEWKIAAK